MAAPRRVGAAPTRNVPLFSLHKLLSFSKSVGASRSAWPPPLVSGGSSGGDLLTEYKCIVLQTGDVLTEDDVVILQEMQAAQERPKPPVVNAVAIGCTEKGSVMALALSNDFLVLREAPRDGTPAVRQLPWFKEPVKRVAAMDVSPSLDWLLCVTHDCTVCLVPIQALCSSHTASLPHIDVGQRWRGRGTLSGSTSREPSGRRGAPTTSVPSLVAVAEGKQARLKQKRLPGSALGESGDVTVITASTKAKPAAVMSCTWWHTWSDEHFAVIASFHGNLTFVNLRHRAEQFLFRLKSPILRVEMVADTVSHFKYLLLHAHGGGYWKLLLEQRGDDGGYENIMGNLGKAPFLPVYLTRFSAGSCRLSVQSSHCGPVIGVFYFKSGKYEVYDAELNKFPLYVYHVPPHSRFVHLTDKFLFAVGSAGPGKEESRLSVISKWIAAGNAAKMSGDGHYVPDCANAVMQHFTIPPDQKIIGMSRVWSGGRRRESDSDVASGGLDLEGVILWSSNVVYECRHQIPADAIFNDLLSRGLEKSDAEPLGVTVGLDLLSLYETAADRCYDHEQYSRALVLYNLSNVRTNKIVYKFINANRMDTVTRILEDALSNPAALSLGARKCFSNMLFHCHLHGILLGSPISSPSCHERLRNFLIHNQDYDRSHVMHQLAECGFKELLVEVGDSRIDMPLALRCSLDLGEPGLSSSKRAIRLLKERGYATELMTQLNGVVFRCLSPEAKAQILLADYVTARKYYTLLVDILPHVDDSILTCIANFFEHSENNWKKSIDSEMTFHAPSIAVGCDRTDAHRPEEWRELFLTALLILNRDDTHAQSRIAEAGYGQDALERLLDARFGLYRPAVMIQRCRDWENYRAEAAIFERLGALSDGLEHRLLAATSDTTSPLFSNILPLIQSHVGRPEDQVDRSHLLRQLMAFWSEHKLPTKPLEEYLLNHMERVGNPASLLLQDPVDVLPWTLGFSAQFYFSVVQERVGSIMQNKT